MAGSSLAPTSALAAHGELEEDAARRSHRGIRLAVGGHGGGTLNPDQWLAGAHAIANGLFIRALSSELAVSGTLGGNHGGARAALRLGYTFWLSEAFGLGAVAGASGEYYFPVGDFARFCDRVDLDACSGFGGGIELGGAVRYDFLRAMALGGIAELPAVTLVLAADFELSGGR